MAGPRIQRPSTRCTSSTAPSWTSRWAMLRRWRGYCSYSPSAARSSSSAPRHAGYTTREKHDEYGRGDAETRGRGDPAPSPHRPIFHSVFESVVGDPVLSHSPSGARCALRYSLLLAGVDRAKAGHADIPDAARVGSEAAAVAELSQGAELHPLRKLHLEHT